MIKRNINIIWRHRSDGFNGGHALYWQIWNDDVGNVLFLVFFNHGSKNKFSLIMLESMCFLFFCGRIDETHRLLWGCVSSSRPNNNSLLLSVVEGWCWANAIFMNSDDLYRKILKAHVAWGSARTNPWWVNIYSFLNSV